MNRKSHKIGAALNALIAFAHSSFEIRFDYFFKTQMQLRDTETDSTNVRAGSEINVRTHLAKFRIASRLITNFTFTTFSLSIEHTFWIFSDFREKFYAGLNEQNLSPTKYLRSSRNSAERSYRDFYPGNGIICAVESVLLKR